MINKRSALYLACAFGLVILGIAVVLFFSNRNQDQQSAEILASFYPLGNFSEQLISAEKVETLVPVGVEPHDFELSSGDIIKLSKAKLVIYNGNGMEPWLEDFLETEAGKSVKSLNLSLHIDTPETERSIEYDPHFWLDPVIASEIVDLIAAELQGIYPEQYSLISENAENYKTELDKLHREYLDGLAICQQDTIIVSHDAFNYLANRYGFRIRSISGLSPESEPSAKKLAEITNLVKEKNIKYIFSESLVSPEFSEAIARETEAATLVLNPIENLTTEQELQKEDYLSIMRSNLVNLTLALECQ